MIYGGPIGSFATVYKSGTDASGFGGQVFTGVHFFGSSSSGGIGRSSGRAVVSAQRVAAPAWTDLPAAAEVTAAPSPEIPLPTFSRGPKSAGIVLSNYRRTVTASSEAPQVVFYRWGIDSAVGLCAYYEFVAEMYAETLGGFGVGEVYTSTDSEPGKSDNPGCLIYLEDGELTVWNAGVGTPVGALAAGTRFGVAVAKIGSDELSVRFYVDSALVASSIYVVGGPMWIPTLCTLSTQSFELVDAA